MPTPMLGGSLEILNGPEGGLMTQKPKILKESLTLQQNVHPTNPLWGTGIFWNNTIRRIRFGEACLIMSDLL